MFDCYTQTYSLTGEAILGIVLGCLFFGLCVGSMIRAEIETRRRRQDPLISFVTDWAHSIRKQKQ